MVIFRRSKAETPPPKRSFRSRLLWRWLPRLMLTLMVTILVAVVLWPYVVVTVPSGQVGVLWKRFGGLGVYCLCFVGRGTVLDPREIREEGLHIIWPWDKVFLYDLRLQSIDETYNAISSEGVGVGVTLNIRFQLRHDSVAVLHKFIGPHYAASVVRPEIGSRARDIISGYTAEQVYSSARTEIERQILATVRSKLEDHLGRLIQLEASEQVDRDRYRESLRNGIEFIDTLVLGIKLPPSIVTAINRKTEQYYLAREYSFRIDRERQEAERKQIEATGIAAFQRTVTEGISDSYLRWRGIEATLELARSKNAKTVIIGGRDGLPIILGGVDAPALPGGDSKKPADSPPVAPTAPANKPPAAPSAPPSPP
jgi:regulator of protease activity HflC (stomatin/prohibitin superfamily)